MDLQLTQGAAVVVGGASGIGQAVIERLLAEGAAVACIDCNYPEGTRLDEVQRQGAQGPPRLNLLGDVTDPASLARCDQLVARRLGPLRRLVVAAGAGSGKYGFPFWNLQPGDWPRVLEINLMGAVHCLHQFVPRMVREPEGSIVLFSSVAAQIGSPTDPPYSAAKAAVVNFAQCAARDLAPHNVRVNVVSPGMVQTPLNRSVYEAWRRLQIASGVSAETLPDYQQWGDDKVRRTAPLGRWQTPADLAAATAFLLSPLAGNITGQTLNVDGGQVMR